MKRALLFTLILLIFSNLSAQKANSDSFRMALKGKVKKITSVKVTCPKISAENIKYQCKKDTIIYNFDKKGKLIKEKALQYDSIKKIRSNNELVISKYRINSSGVLKKATEDFYGKKNRLVKQSIYYIHGKEDTLLNQWEYFYNNRGRKKKEIVTDWWNGNKKTRIYFYNDKGDINDERILLNNELNEHKTYKYNYQIDKKGNWIFKDILGHEYRITEKRKIVYY